MDFVCPGINVFAVRKKIRRAFRFAQKWGEQFNGGDFDLYKYWNESMGSDINTFKYSGTDEIIEVVLEGVADIIDQEPIH